MPSNYSSRVFLDGDISTRTFEDADGKKVNTVNITQRKLRIPKNGVLVFESWTVANPF